MAIKENINHSNILTARDREQQVIELLNRFHFLTSKHLRTLIPWHYNVCSRTLARMVKDRAVKRYRAARTAPYIYYINSRSGNVNHWLLLATAYCYMLKKYGITSFEVEVQFSMIRPDGYVKDLNAFVEIDLATNPFNKVSLYRDLFNSDEWINSDTPKNDGSFVFPHVVVVTTRKALLLKQIQANNDLGIDFIILDTDSIRF